MPSFRPLSVSEGTGSTNSKCKGLSAFQAERPLHLLFFHKPARLQPGCPCNPLHPRGRPFPSRAGEIMRRQSTNGAAQMHPGMPAPGQRKFLLSGTPEKIFGPATSVACRRATIALHRPPGKEKRFGHRGRQTVPLRVTDSQKGLCVCRGLPSEILLQRGPNRFVINKH